MSSLTYYIVFGLLLTLGIWSAYRSRQTASVSYWGVWLLLTLFSGLRIGPGRDYSLYELAYNEPLSDTALAFEPAWRALYLILHHFELPFHIWLLGCAGITYAFMLYGFRRLRISWVLGILVYVLVYKGYFESFNTVRQCLSLSICFAGLSDLYQKHYLRAILFVLLASLFHTSAIVCLLLYPLMLVRWSWHWHLLFLALSVLMGRLAFSYALPYIIPLLPERYTSYIEGGVAWTVSTTGAMQYFYCLLAIGAIYHIYQRRSRAKASLMTISAPIDQEDLLRWAIRIFPFAVYLYNTFLTFEPGMRLMGYPFLLIFVILPLMLSRANTLPRLILSIGILSGFALFTFKELTNPDEPYAHYQTVFDDRIPLFKDPLPLRHGEGEDKGYRGNEESRPAEVFIRNAPTSSGEIEKQYYPNSNSSQGTNESPHHRH